MKKSFFIICLVFGFISCHKREDKIKQYSDKDLEVLFDSTSSIQVTKFKKLENYEKIYDVIKLKENDSLKRRYFFRLAGEYYGLGSLDKYIKVCKEVNKLSEESKDTLDIAKSLNYIGNYYYIKFKNDSAYYYFTRAEKLYLIKKSKINIGRIRLYKANILFYEKDFTGAETAVVPILKEAIANNDNRLIYDCYITLGLSLEGLEEYNDAIEYYNKAFEVNKKLIDDPQFLQLKAQTYNYIGKVFTKKKEYKKAVVFFADALSFDDFKNTNPLMYSNLKNNLAYASFKLGDDKVLNSLNEALAIRVRMSSVPGIVSSKINLAEYYLKDKDTIKAFALSSNAVTLARENKIFEDEIKGLKLLVSINPKKSASYNDRIIRLTDSLQNKERATRNKFARIEFETDEILNQKKNIEAEKNKLSSQRWIILGFSLFFIIVIVLLYVAKQQHAKNKELRFIQEQQKANEEIYQLMLNQQVKMDEVKQAEKKRISQELHDGIMSKLTSTRLNLFILSKRTDQETIERCLKHIDGLQDIEKEIRTISHDLNRDSFLQANSFTSMLYSLIEDQKNYSDTNFVLEIEEHINWEKIDSIKKMHLYRIFQEALQNIRKYANATEVHARIQKEEDTICVEISDNGDGFDIEKSREGIGLKNMYSRTKSIQGSIKFKTAKGAGTTISLIFPT